MKVLDRITVVVTGATGNNAFKAVLPGIAELFRDTCLGKSSGLSLDSRIVLVGRQAFDATDTEEMKRRLFYEYDKFGMTMASRLLKVVRGFTQPMLDRLFQQTEYVHVKDAGNEQSFGAVCRRVAELEPDPANRRIVWFLNQDPHLNRRNAEFIGRARLVPKEWAEGGTCWEKLLIEKPLGSDYRNAFDFVESLRLYFGAQSQYFIDHYLGKAFTSCFKDWLSATRLRLDSKNVDWMMFLLAEDEHLNGRAAYYDGSGAFRDMGQNHILQLFALTCMNRPDMDDDDRTSFLEERAKVLEHVGALKPEDILRAQYDGYRSETGVNPESLTETAFAMRLGCDLPRWKGVPIYAISGKAFPWKTKKIVVRFKPLRSYHDGRLLPANVVVFNWEPQAGIYQRLSLTVGEKPITQHHWLDLEGDISKDGESPYARIIRNCVRGDRFVFPSADEILNSWRICNPVLEHWNAAGAEGLLTYRPGTAPREFDQLFKGLPKGMPWYHDDWIVGGR